MLCRPLSIFEVNALLPLVQDRMEELHLYWDQAQTIRKQMLKQVSAEPGLGTQSQKVPSSVLEAELAEIEALITGKLLHLQRYGAFVREIFPGVVEFYSTRAGAPVLLNWHFGEEAVSQWLSLDGEMSEPSEIVDQSLFGNPILH